MSKLENSSIPDTIHFQQRPILYTATNSPFGLKVHGFLTHKRIPFENIYCKASDISKQVPVGGAVPVLTVNGESRRDSTPIGIWLDELYPARPHLLPPEEPLRQKLLDIDQWVTDQVIGLRFRATRPIESGEFWSAVKRARMLAELFDHTAPGGMPKLKKYFWPLIYQLLPHVTSSVRKLDLDEPIADARERVCREFIQRLEGGPFLAGQAEPTLPDLAAYPALVSQYLAGLPNADFFIKHDEMKVWAKRMEEHLKGGMSMVPPRMVKHSLPD